MEKAVYRHVCFAGLAVSRFLPAHREDYLAVNLRALRLAALLETMGRVIARWRGAAPGYLNTVEGTDDVLPIVVGVQQLRRVLLHCSSNKREDATTI